MKITKKVTVLVCDFCKKHEANEWNSCPDCGRVHCYDCRKEGHEFPHAVHCSGSGDGWYCNACYQKQMIGSIRTPLFNAFLAVERLRQENEQWYQDFKRRTTVAEETLKKIPRPT